MLVRLYRGRQFFQAGSGKIETIPQVTGFFTELGSPLPGLSARVVAGRAFAGGILLIAGLVSRLIAIPLTVNTLVAHATVDREALPAVISDPDRFFAAAPYTFLLASLIVLVFGPGKFALDAWIGSECAATAGEAAAEATAGQ